MSNEPAYANRWVTIHFDRRDGFLLIGAAVGDQLPVEHGGAPVEGVVQARHR